MSNKIGSQLVQAILAMQKDPSKLAVELSVHVFMHDKNEKTGGSLKPHLHCDISSPLVENKDVFRDASWSTVDAVSNLKQPLVYGRYVLSVGVNRTILLTSAPEGATDEMKDFMIRRTGSVLLQLANSLEDALAEWPSELKTEHMLAAGYSDIMRKKLERGTNTDPIKVVVVGKAEHVIRTLENGLPIPSFLRDMIGMPKSAQPNQNGEIRITAFSDANPCSPAVRQAYAAYAQEMLDNKIESMLAPKIVERVRLVLDTLATRLAKRQVVKLNEATMNPTQTAVGTGDGIGTEVGDDATKTTNVPEALSGGIGRGSSEVSFNPPPVGHDTNGQSTGVPA